MRQHGLHNPKQTCNLKDTNTSRSGPGRCLSPLQTDTLSDSHLPCSVLAGSPSRWLTGMWMDIQPSVLPKQSRTVQWPAWKTHCWGAVTSWERKMYLKLLPTERATGVIIKMATPMLIIRKHKIKTEARSTTVAASALCNGKLLTARYCLPSNSSVWVLCTNIYRVPWVHR